MQLSDRPFPLEAQHAALVRELVKPPEDIIASLTPAKMRLWHAVPALVIETGELADPIKKHVIYGKPLDGANIVEELGDIEFYLQEIRDALGITREATLEANIGKLRVRYEKGYSDKAAQERADKMLTNETQKEGN